MKERGIDTMPGKKFNIGYNFTEIIAQNPLPASNTDPPSNKVF